MKRSDETHPPEAWGLHADTSGELCVGSHRFTALAKEFGTPLHVVHLDRLRDAAGVYLAAARRSISPDVSVHFAFKCNAVPAIIRTLRNAGLQAEVMSPLELELAVACGFRPLEIVVNGPCKSDAFLHRCISVGVRLVNLDSIEELVRFATIARSLNEAPSVLLRINPDIASRGAQSGNATGRRATCAFGLDLRGGEVEQALRLLSTGPVRFEGFSVHVGTNIQDPSVYRPVIRCLAELCRRTGEFGLSVRTLDLGGGFASGTSRSYTSLEMLMKEVVPYCPSTGPISPGVNVFLKAIGDALREQFEAGSQPSIILEPGRCLTSNAQSLLLGVHAVKKRAGLLPWIITDGGLGTVSLPTYYESHEMLLCNDLGRPRRRMATVLGPGCFAADAVVRNKRLPSVVPGEVLAVMDSGAYFTALESTFGHPRPAIIGVDGDDIHVLRRRETLDDVVERDLCEQEELPS